MSEGARTVIALGVVAGVAIALGLLWPQGETRPMLREAEGHADVTHAGGGSAGGGSAGGGSAGGAWIGGGGDAGGGGARRGVIAGDAGVLSASASDLAPARPLVRLDHPPTPAENLERAGLLHDYIVVRRDDVRRRISELEASGETAGLTRLLRELEGLENAERDARERVAEYARNARAAAEAESPEAP